ncbi:MAG: Hpt domain-containing protein [Lachnospiraceae bacterium]|nr:Hpt domain-containing protein [Lachnospiraceae bacterium]
MINKEDFLEKLYDISGINIETGMRYASGILDVYYESLRIFFEKVSDESKNMENALKNNDLKSFGITVHAMKSMLLTIGASELSETAAILETKAKESDSDFCQSQYPDFQEELDFLNEGLADLFPVKEACETVKEAGSKNFLLEKLEKALVACTEFDNDTATGIMTELSGYDFGEGINTTINESLSALKDFDIDGAELKLKKLIMDTL